MSNQTPEQIAKSVLAPLGIEENGTVKPVNVDLLFRWLESAAAEGQASAVRAPQYVIIRGGSAVALSENVVVLDVDLEGGGLLAGEQVLAKAKELHEAGAPIETHLDYIRAWVEQTHASEKDPRAITCEVCNAEPGRPCVGISSGSHAARRPWSL